MSWLSVSAFEPHLPDHCVPETDFLLRFSSTFHSCIPTPLAFVSNSLGSLSIVAWLCAQLPQIWKNWSIQSTSGLSIGFLVVWLLGDLSNLLGAIFTYQASWQIAIGSYYVFVDLCLVGQWVWFEKLRHGHPVFRLQGKENGRQRDTDGAGGGSEHIITEGRLAPGEDGGTVSEDDPSDNTVEGEDPSNPPTQPTRSRIIFRTPTFLADRGEKGEKALSSFSGTPRSDNTIYRVGSGSSPVPSPSPRTMILVACLIAIARASPISMSTSTSAHALKETPATPLEMAGTILSWISTCLYLSSRFPQLIKNWRRKSTEGLSPLLFAAAFCGNFFYSSALVTNPCLWNDFGPYGGGGWVGGAGSDRVQWGLAALPFFLGAFGVLGLDGSVGVQFWLYGEDSSKLVVVEGGRRGSKWHWRRVSGWMRGWIPSISDGGKPSAEREALLRNNHGQEHGNGYGAL